MAKASNIIHLNGQKSQPSFIPLGPIKQELLLPLLIL